MLERPAGRHLCGHASRPVEPADRGGRFEEERVGPGAVAHEEDPVARLRLLETCRQGQEG